MYGNRFGSFYFAQLPQGVDNLHIMEGTHMKISGYNNLVWYKVENTMDLQCFLP